MPFRGSARNRTRSATGLLKRLLGLEEAEMKVSLAAVLFPEAAAVWLESRRPYLSPNAFDRYGFYLRPLQAFFREMRLPEISPDQIRAYQRARSAQVSATVINHECSCLQQMLGRIGRWAEIGHDYQPLPLPKAEVGRALTDSEYTRLFRMAASNPNWQAAFLFAAISVNTSAGPGEIKTLHLRDVEPQEKLLHVNAEGAKNPGRQRSIPLNAYALAAVRQALERAAKLGAMQPEHYVFPFRVRKGRYDPERHQLSFRTAWRELCAAADIRNFRMYDLRHHAITSLLENPQVSEETAEAIAGHISRRMKKRYSHIRMEYKRKAVDSLKPPWQRRA